MEKDEFFAIMKSIPKAELHIHVEAVPTMETLKALHKKSTGEVLTDEEIKTLFSYDNLDGFIKAFLKVQDMLVSVDDFNFVFDDLAKYLVANNIVYCEAFFAPTAFLKKGFDYGKMVLLFSKKIAEIKRKHRITVKLLVDVSRTFGIENALNNYALLKKYPCKDVIGIGLGGAESKGACNEYKAVFDKALNEGFHAVCHAGEDIGPESIWEAVNLLHAERIGHAVTAIQDEKLMAELKNRQIPLEICVTSNIFTKKYVKMASEHPIRQYFDDGLLVTVNTDDPVFFKTTLTEEYWKLYSECNFSLDEIKQLIINSFNASFMSEKDKANWIEKVESLKV